MPRPNLRRTSKLDDFEQAMREDPQDAPGSRLSALRRHYGPLLQGIGFSVLVLLAGLGLGLIIMVMLGDRP